MRRKLQLIMLVAVSSMALALFSDTAAAQGRGGHGGGGGRAGGGGHPGGGPPPSAGHPGGAPGHPGGAPVHGSVYIGGYYGYGGYWGYPYWGFGWGWGYPYWGGYYGGYPYWGYDPTPEIRLEVKPKQAQVYVDGYYAGIVDDFDGTFQRLRIQPGTHELVLYLQGYQTVRQNIHVGSGQDSKIKFQMQPLAAGETNEPPPQPTAPPQSEPQGYGAQAPRQAPEPRYQPPMDQNAVEPGQGFGALVIRVQPSGAEILVDGDRWQGPEGSERLVIQLSEGTHRIEVRKDGFVPFSTTVQVRRGETSPVNVSLPPRGE